MNLPNLLTFTRCIIIPFAVLSLFLEALPYNYVLAAVLFLTAQITDILDGYFARKYHLITKLGIFLDPLSDKLIMLMFALFLQSKEIYPLWLILLTVARETVVDSLRNFAIAQNVYLGAAGLGKLKAFFQAISIFSGLIFLIITKNQLFLGLFNAEILVDFAFYTFLLALIVSLGRLKILFGDNIYLLFRNKS